MYKYHQPNNLILKVNPLEGIICIFNKKCKMSEMKKMILSVKFLENSKLPNYDCYT